MFAGSVGVMGVIFFYFKLLCGIASSQFLNARSREWENCGLCFHYPFSQNFQDYFAFFLSFITLAYAFAVPQLSWFVILLQIFAPSQELSKQGCILEAAIEASATAIINLKDSLNEWDSKVGDGDCGTTVS